MKSVYVSLAFIIIFFAGCSEKPLYQTKDFSIHRSEVRQGKFSAVATDTSLKSSYASGFKIKQRNNLFFKLAINGEDNERDFAQNHQWLIPTGVPTVESPIFIFGQADPPLDKDPEYLDQDVTVTFRVDMRPVFRSFSKNGYFETFNKKRIDSVAYKGVWMSGGLQPLTWEFGELINRPDLKMEDPDKDTIFTLNVRFEKEVASPDQMNPDGWKHTMKLENFPSYQSEFPILNALYKLSLEEMLLNVREDGAFMAGAKWTGVWTRDISYSIQLALAAVHPDASKVSLMAKTENGRIIQDTGTGGSWPVSTDRLVWSLAAWEIYLATGDRDWLNSSYQIINKSVMADQQTAVNSDTGLLLGESSFLDWREQSYPRWMDPKDIYDSYALGTNAVYVTTVKILGEMADELNDTTQIWNTQFEKAKTSFTNEFWMADSGYFSQFIYGRQFKLKGPGSETLGNSLVVLNELADDELAAKSMHKLAVYPFGTPTFHPQLAEIPPYHNKSVWPFVQAYYTLAAAKTGFHKGVEHGLASMIRAAALFQTNKENMVVKTGDFMGTEINSDRQLWSVAGQLAMVYKLLTGLTYQTDGLSIQPMIPAGYAGKQVLSNLNYRKSIVNLTISGFGDGIASVTINGAPAEKAFIPAYSEGEFTVDIVMNNSWKPTESLRLMDEVEMPGVPVLSLNENGTSINWKKTLNANKYEVFVNGKSVNMIERSEAPSWEIGGNGYREIHVRTINSAGVPSLFSNPVVLKGTAVSEWQAEAAGYAEKSISGFTGTGYIRYNTSKNPPASWKISVKDAGIYELRARYANGGGPVNTNNRCGIRSVYLNNIFAGSMVFPQRGDEAWSDWGESSALRLNLNPGTYVLSLKYDTWNTNMNRLNNEFLLDSWQLVKID